jgi:hypothetical protein
MRVEHNLWTLANGWESAMKNETGKSAQLVFIFGATELIKNGKQIKEIKKMYPQACIIGCSTSGEIYGTRVLDESIAATIINFDYTEVSGSSERIREIGESFQVGEKLAGSINKANLAHVMVFSDGLKINGSELVKGLSKNLPSHVCVTGGLSGDGDRFHETYVIWNGELKKDIVAAIGFYGSRLKIGYGSVGGWDPFGPERLITRSKANVLYEMDGKSALELYKMYLGDQAKNLPASGLLFPLSLRISDNPRPVVRTLLSINEKDQSMIFAGDVPEGSYARLMKANFDRLIQGAADSAKASYMTIGSISPDLAILISCVGRKLILGQRVEEEVEGVRDILGERTVLAGFYSYGEISPFSPGSKCELHNQTMTITAFSEKE